AYDALLPPEHQPDTGGRRLGGPPLVGRSAERARLTALWREAQAGIGPRLVLVRGEAGVGKSRLVEELEAWCAHRGMVTAHARSYAAEGSLAFGPVVTWLRSAVIRPRLAGADLEDLSELGRLMPELASGQPALSRPALPDTDHRQLFDAVARVLLGPGIPLMLVLDDIQWADRETLRLVHFLIRQDPPAPLLVVAAVRSEDADDAQFSGLTTGLRALGRTVEIDLGRLSREETALLAERLSGRRLTESEVDALQSQTEGNPLFVVEAMRAGWRPGATWLTPKVQAAVESRLSQLSGPTRDLVGVAATIGREFTWPVLAAASRADEDVLVISLDELWQRRIIVDHGADAYDFSHDKIREVAYLGLRPAQRRHHHLRVAQALAQVHQDDPGRVSGQLAVHCESAGDIRAAITWYARAAEVAQQVNAHEEAVRLLDRALALLPRLQGDEERGARELEVSTALLAPLAIVEGYCSRRLLATQEAVFALSRRLGVDPAPELLRSAALARLSTNDLATAQQHGDQLLTTGVRLHDGVLIAEGHYVLGICGFWQADFEAARTHFEAAVEHYRPEHRDVHLVRYGTDPKVVCLSRLANTLWFLGQPEEAVRARDAALAYAEEIDHPGSVGTALVFAAALALDMGDLSRFRSYAAALDADARRQPKVNRLAAELFAGLLDVLDGRAQPGWARIDRLQRETDSGAFAPGSRALVARVVLEAARATGDTSRVIEAADRLLTVGGGEVWAETARRVRDGSPARGG
ncbi:MAG TPA: AAA family ATPase, partial [Nocardioides sp.]